MISCEINGIIAMGLSMMAEHDQMRADWRDRILEEWIKSENYPRKRKKQVRKKLRVEYAIASYDPFKMPW
jgi:hypothetical protein